MIKKEKIRQMVRNEVYLQSQFRQDCFAVRYYKADYVGLQRIKCLIVFGILYIMYWIYYAFKIFYVEGEGLLHFDYQGFVIKVVILMIVLGAIVGVVATVIASNRYEQASKRIMEHEDLVSEIARM